MPNQHTGLLSSPRRLLLLAGLGTLASCASMMERGFGVREFFPGVQLDYVVATGHGSDRGGLDSLPFRVIWVTFDLPFSLAADSLLMPLDALLMWQHSYTEARQNKLLRQTKRELTPKEATDGAARNASDLRRDLQPYR
ncbi:MAG: hypothetical protein ACI90M_003211 [Candidatus Azotimanducaceae bacterium]|jgi:uncharacterized protein YceK